MTDTLVTLPAPVAKRDYRGKDARTLETSVQVGTLPNGDAVELVFSVHHNSDRKCFSASATRRQAGRGFYSMSVHEDFLSMGSVQVARYSAKGLREFYDRMVPMGSELAEMTAWAQGKKQTR